MYFSMKSYLKSNHNHTIKHTSSNDDRKDEAVNNIFFPLSMFFFSWKRQIQQCSIKCHADTFLIECLVLVVFTTVVNSI
jgi:hypothetical protein